ncbi:ZIP family metal transporter [Candidatus Wolfebacteria bacterium]|nr:ZIP family metal transporter [Candidatus Wolfebacteria bacterium]
MTVLWLYALGSVVLVSALSLVGALTLRLRDRVLKRLVFILVGLSVGALLGDVFIHLLPELFEGASDVLYSSLTVLLGIMLFFVLEKFLRWHHSHEVHEHSGPDCPEPDSPLTTIVLVGDGVHNLIDGMIIGASYLVSIPVGLATTLAVALHEIPQEIGDFGVLLHAGLSRSRALFYNLLSGLVSIVGVATVLIFGNSVSVTSTLLSLAVGGFIYIAGSDLVPELHKENSVRSSLMQLVAIGVGIGLMFLLLFVE